MYFPIFQFNFFLYVTCCRTFYTRNQNTIAQLLTINFLFCFNFYFALNPNLLWFAIVSWTLEQVTISRRYLICNSLSRKHTWILQITMVGMKRFCFSCLFFRHTKSLLQKLQLQLLLFRSMYLKETQYRHWFNCYYRYSWCKLISVEFGPRLK